MTEYYDPGTYPQEWNYLQPGTIIDHYMIERELAHGGFSSVYLARQLNDQTQVAIKEYLPRKLAHRTWNNRVVPHSDSTKSLFNKGRALFFEEAKVLVDLKHPNIVEVTNFFQENATVYMVMTYDYGLTLDKLLLNKNFEVTEEFIVLVLQRLLTALAIIHNHHILHLDIKPGNILIRPGFDPLILDFGAIQHYPPVGKSVGARICTPGFSPVEQFSAQGLLGPWTDLYAFGATVRAIMERKAPIGAVERAQEDVLKPARKVFKNKYSLGILELVDWLMAVEPAKRPQSVQELLASIK